MTLALRDAADAPRAGKKAQVLARLMAAGLPVLDGIVVLPDEPVPDPGRVAALGPGPFVVRSSSALEDEAGASAAGLYLSLIGVPLAGVADAIERVRASAATEAVSAYLEARGRSPQPIAALIQPRLAGAVLGVARSVEGGFLVEERAAGTPEWGDATAARLDRALGDPLVSLLLRVEQILGGRVDVEYARERGELVLLQARPGPASPTPAVPITYPPGRWRLDAEHNPDPISLAQAGLVELVDGRRFGPRARVIGGYLYVREQPSVERADEDRPPGPELEALRHDLDSVDEASLPAALAAYVRVIRRYARELRPAVGAARERLDALLHRELGESLWDHPQLLAGTGGASTERDAALYVLGREPTESRLAEYLRRFGAYAPAWDVAVPCDDEDHARLLAAAARRALGPSPDALARAASTRATEAAQALRERIRPGARDELDRALAQLRARLTLAESDDLVFFAGQRLVRRALLRRGEALVEAGRLRAVDDVFDLPLTAALTARPLDELAAEGRLARIAAARFVPPARIVDRRPQVRLPASSEVLHGHGTGGQGRGPAVVIPSLVAPLPEVPEGAVLIVPAALPSLAPLLPRLAGLVTEHGGALSHGITLAREVGLPAVVGVAGALSIPAGTRVHVDGERGRVLLLRPSA